MRKSAAVIAVVVAGSVASTALVASATQFESVFERLNALDARAHVAESSQDELRARIATTDGDLEARWDSMDVARRAAQPIRVDVNRTFSGWLSSFRAATREAVHGPVAAEDSLRLLSYAAPRTLPSKLQDVDVIRRADEQSHAYETLLLRRAELTIDLARAAAQGDTAREGREAVVSTAKTVGASDDLQATADLLEKKLQSLPAGDATFDFHRFKGTLARPIARNPDFAFKAQAPLVRETGLMWRTEPTEVFAAAPGRVAMLEPIEGWGRVLVVDHGGGYRSVYAHLGRVDVAVGDTVERAAVLGMSGDTGSLDGPRLQFELRKDGSPVDPMLWFLKR